MANTPRIVFTFSEGQKIAKAAESIDDVIETFNKYSRAGYPKPYTVKTEIDGAAITFLFYKKTWKSFPEITVAIKADG
ncbi:MAG: hypothetical protein OSB62_02415 [Alphaproteobacteria bacterium]|nr:hypothetical protein [Alphaproteobacteria bacterium]